MSTHGRPCRYCRAPIEFVEGPSGRAIPVQRVRTVYRLEGAKLAKAELGAQGELFDRTAPPLFVSHFETCPDADKAHAAADAARDSVR